ncbi:cysteine protease [Lithospermum erythrorhizon]|uniref:Ubiquitin carboxyl-terminal hydrolase n=1 Tax=Lithospermum erythrorhizon TaxID=34254 RepID=A0AAV3PV10_LITER
MDKMENQTSEDSSNVSPKQPQDQLHDQRVYLVPYSWWKEADDPTSSNAKDGVLYSASVASYGGPMRLINNIFCSDLAFNLRREDDASLQNGENGKTESPGRGYALVPADSWLEALKWHSDSKSALKDGKNSPTREDDMSDVYPLQLRLSVSRENNSLGVKISKKDNSLECFKRACRIFSTETEQWCIWDFSGKTTLYLSNDKNKILKDSPRQSEQDMLLELQVYGLSDPIKTKGARNEDTVQSSNGTSVMMNGTNGDIGLKLAGSDSSAILGSSGEAGTLGLTGLQNLGNTCFMNSALQCLAHTPKIVDYFLGDYMREINHDNPLGMNGEIASAFGDLLKKLWAPGASPVAPRTFKLKLAHFAPQFSGYNQHDSQELLAFLLDGLHEDLNRVKCKPYVEVKDEDDRPDEEVADEYWGNHLARNDSIIVDVCQGQYRSKLVCPDCRKVSVTFDPFMYLSLPLPSTSTRTMTLTVVKSDGSSPPSSHTITVPKNGKLEDLTQALSIACSLGVDEAFLVAEIYNNRLIRLLEEPSDSLSLIRDGDRLVAYRLPKDYEKKSLVVFMHQQKDRQNICGNFTSSWKAFGLPLLSHREVVNGSDICGLYHKLLNPYLVPNQDSIDDSERKAAELSEVTEDTSTSKLSGSTDTTETGELETQSETGFQFYLTDDKGTIRGSEILLNEPVKSTALSGRTSLLVCWPEKEIEQYNMQLFNSLPEVCKSGFFTKRPQESISLYRCLEAFLKEEPLGPEDMWYCPICKKHCQASKKLDLWRLPEILVIHLKRFSYSRFLKNKLETFVDFPVRDLDLSEYITFKDGEPSYRYVLYAISNHFGSMGGGHYTAFVHQGGNLWYDFDDSHVSAINEDKIKTSAAYLLFYRRVDSTEG